jgi:hypothetical protein
MYWLVSISKYSRFLSVMANLSALANSLYLWK